MSKLRVKGGKVLRPEEAMHPTPSMKVLDESGHTVMPWNPGVDEEVEAARESFNELTRERHFLAFATPKGGETVMLREFDETAEEIILIPQMAGG